MLTYADVEGSQACIEEQAAERAALLVQLASVEGEAEAARLRLVRVESELGVALSGRASDAVEKQQGLSLLAVLVQKYLRYWHKSALTRTRSSWQRNWRESGLRGRGREVRLSASAEQSASRRVVRKICRSTKK
jgi:hypothetical protein